MKTLMCIIGGAVLVGVTGGLAAGPIACSLGSAGLLGLAGTGTAVGSLSGAALTSASLAAVGTGTVASGVVTVATASTLAGAGAGAIVDKMTD